MHRIVRCGVFLYLLSLTYNLKNVNIIRENQGGMSVSVYLLVSAIIIFVCVLFNRVSKKLGIPALLTFIALGMCFGSDGIFKINFDNYIFAERICSIALIFIMFYGGAGTRIKEAKSVAVKSMLLSSLGTVLTAFLVGIFCHYVLKIAILESFLIGSVISSTDAASVFSILRSKKLALRYKTASMLELESGSNDPFSYMLTIIFLTIMTGDISSGKIAYMIFAQIVYGGVFGVVLAYGALWFFKKYKFKTEGMDAIFVVAVALMSYAAPSLIGGNGYLSAYICGIILGNHEIRNKRTIIHFFDGVTGLMQMLLFFLLGLLSFPSQLPSIAPTAVIIALFLTFVARPLAVAVILTPFGCKLNQQTMVSWSGLRGAASIVFAIMTVVNPAVMDNDIFHIVFFIVLFSILIQGSLIPMIAKKLNMIDEKDDILKTFTDYSYELPVSFIEFKVPKEHQWADKTVQELNLPKNLIIVLILRGEEKIIPKGATYILANDKIILCGRSGESVDGVAISEIEIDKKHPMCDQTIKNISKENEIVVMIKRGKNLIIPDGNTMVLEQDVVIVNKNN